MAANAPQHEPWSAEEDRAILRLVSEVGPRWTLISQSLQGRSDSSVRNRFVRLTNPVEEKVRDRAAELPWTAEDDELLRQGILKHGFKWRAIIRELLPSRTCNAVRNRFQRHLARTEATSSNTPIQQAAAQATARSEARESRGAIWATQLKSGYLPPATSTDALTQAAAIVEKVEQAQQRQQQQQQEEEQQQEQRRASYILQDAGAAMAQPSGAVLACQPGVVFTETHPNAAPPGAVTSAPAQMPPQLQQQAQGKQVAEQHPQAQQYPVQPVQPVQLAQSSTVPLTLTHASHCVGGTPSCASLPMTGVTLYVPGQQQQQAQQPTPPPVPFVTYAQPQPAPQQYHQQQYPSQQYPPPPPPLQQQQQQHYQQKHHHQKLEEATEQAGQPQGQQGQQGQQGKQGHQGLQGQEPEQPEQQQQHVSVSLGMVPGRAGAHCLPTDLHDTVGAVFTTHLVPTEQGMRVMQETRQAEQQAEQQAMQQQAQTTAIGPAADLNDIASQASYIAAQFEEQQEKREKEAMQQALGAAAHGLSVGASEISLAALPLIALGMGGAGRAALFEHGLLLHSMRSAQADGPKTQQDSSSSRELVRSSASDSPPGGAAGSSSMLGKRPHDWERQGVC